MASPNRKPQQQEEHDISTLVTGVDTGEIVEHGKTRHYLTQSEITFLSETYPEVLVEAEKKGMIPPEDAPFLDK